MFARSSLGSRHPGSGAEHLSNTSGGNLLQTFGNYRAAARQLPDRSRRKLVGKLLVWAGVKRGPNLAWTQQYNFSCMSRSAKTSSSAQNRKKPPPLVPRDFAADREREQEDEDDGAPAPLWSVSASSSSRRASSSSRRSEDPGPTGKNSRRSA